MVYLFESGDSDASIVYNPIGLTEEDLIKAIQVEALPTPQTPDGMVAILKCEKATEKVWYEYGEYIEPEPEPEPIEPEPFEPQPTQEDIQMQILLNSEYLVALAEINSL